MDLPAQIEDLQKLLVDRNVKFTFSVKSKDGTNAAWYNTYYHPTAFGKVKMLIVNCPFTGYPFSIVFEISEIGIGDEPFNCFLSSDTKKYRAKESKIIVKCRGMEEEEVCCYLHPDVPEEKKLGTNCKITVKCLVYDTRIKQTYSKDIVEWATRATKDTKYESSNFVKNINKLDLTKDVWIDIPDNVHNDKGDNAE